MKVWVLEVRWDGYSDGNGCVGVYASLLSACESLDELADDHKRDVLDCDGELPDEWSMDEWFKQFEINEMEVQD